jgi:FkbM family methyltransferase
MLRGNLVLRIARRHAIYLDHMLDEFEYYTQGVEPLALGGLEMVDYSTPRYHKVTGFEDYPILLPSVSEPVSTTSQYLGFAALAPGMGVMDLGAYSGLTSILFSKAVGAGGLVVAVEADPANIACIRTNFANFARYCGNPIHLIEGAAWSDDGGLEFSSEGNMGASATTIVGRRRGRVTRMPSYTLSSIAEKGGLKRVDFIKCDVEGAERNVLMDKGFFKSHQPRIVIDTHVVDGMGTAQACVSELESLGYRCERIAQHGFSQPLLQCSPPAGR